MQLKPSFSLMHKETREYIYPLNRQKVLIKVEFSQKESYDIRIIYWKRFRNNTARSKQMKAKNIIHGSRYYEVVLGFDSTIRYLNYIFEIRYQQQTFYFSPRGLSSSKPKQFFEFQSINEKDVFETPKKMQGAIGYHIFVERFYNGDSTNDPKDVVPWTSVPTRENFFGGDLIGIAKKVEYLKQLGVNVVILTPIFRALSNHKYDTIDYFDIDPHFGQFKDFQKLVETLHEHGIHIVLDAVFNHIGYYSPIFQDVIENNKQSKYWKWFYISGNKVNTNVINYECVGDFKWMPKLNTSYHYVQKYFIKVALYWLEKGHIDGWRLDVGDELDYHFRQQLRTEIKKRKPNACIIAETWHNGQDLLRGDEVDSIMNYRLREGIIDYLVHETMTKEAFEEYINHMYFDYPIQTHHLLYNLLDSHDTARFLTVCQGNVAIYQLGVVLQMMLPGMPVIYYGDEIGMTGETDPLCRAGMAWDQVNLDIQSFYQSMISYRQTYDAIRLGDYHIIDISKHCFVFTRTYLKQTILVVVNPTDQNRIITLNETVVKQIHINQPLTIHVDAYGYVIKEIV